MSFPNSVNPPTYYNPFKMIYLNCDVGNCPNFNFHKSKQDGKSPPLQHNGNANTYSLLVFTIMLHLCCMISIVGYHL